MEANIDTILDIKTNFFRAIKALNIEGNLNLTIRQLKDGQMVVSTKLDNERVGDDARLNIIPLNMTSTPKELDEGYFKRICTPLKKTSGLLSNMEAHLKSIEEATKKSRMEQDKKKAEKSKNADKEAKVEDEEAYKQALEKSFALEKEMKYDEALKALPQAADFPKRKNEIAEKRKELEAKIKLASSLFSQEQVTQTSNQKQ